MSALITTLTPEQRQAIARAGEQPVRVEDPKTHAAYIILKAEVFERLRAVFDDGDFDPRETCPLVRNAMKEDWEDPAMDVYDGSQTP